VTPGLPFPRQLLHGEAGQLLGGFVAGAWLGSDEEEERRRAYIGARA